MYGLVGKKSIGKKPFFLKGLSVPALLTHSDKNVGSTFGVQPIWPPTPDLALCTREPVGWDGLILPGKPSLSKGEPHRFPLLLLTSKKKLHGLGSRHPVRTYLAELAVPVQLLDPPEAELAVCQRGIR
jgi:hypothetical protein